MARAPLVISGSDPVSVTLANITAYVNAGGTVTPAPVFTTQPSISPTSGTAGTTTFTATDGVASNATSYARRWLLNGTSISTGTTVTPNAAGSLALEVKATGTGGSAVATTAAVTVATAIPAATFTVSNPTLVDYQQFARTTKTGGWADKGTATIPAWPINVTTAGAIYARLVAKGDPNRADGTVIQDAWQLAANVPAGTTAIDVTGCGCGAAWFQVQLSGSATGPWQSAPNPVKLGVGVAVFGTGQSIIQTIANGGGQALADVSVNVNPYLSYYETTDDGSGHGNTVPLWTAPPQTGAYSGAGFAQLGDRLQKSLGVNIILAAHSHGGIPAAGLLKNADGSNGTDFGYLTAIMDGIKAWEYTWWFQGHTDASFGRSGRAYQCYLRWFFGYAAFKNFWGKATVGLVMGIPNTDGWGSDAQKNEIRSAQYRWAKTEGAAACTNGCYYANLYNMEVFDGTHPNQTGAKRVGNLVADVLINGADAPAGDDALGPLGKSAFIEGTGTDGTPTYTGAGKFVAAALNGGTGAFNDSPPIGPCTMGAWVKNATGSGIALDLGSGFYVQKNGGDLYLNSGGNQQQTGGPKLTDNGADWHYLSVEVDFHPYDQTKARSATMFIDGVAIPGCTAVPTGNSSSGTARIRAYDGGGGYVFNPAVCSDFTVYNRLNVPVPTGKVSGNETGLYAAASLNGSGATLL